MGPLGMSSISDKSIGDNEKVTNPTELQISEELSSIREHLAELEQLLANGEHQEKAPSDLLFQLPAAFYIVENGLFKSASIQLREITGYSEREILGTSPLSLIAARIARWLRIVSPGS
jgi:hypothetical protein